MLWESSDFTQLLGMPSLLLTRKVYPMLDMGLELDFDIKGLQGR